MFNMMIVVVEIGNGDVFRLRVCAKTPYVLCCVWVGLKLENKCL